MTTLQETKHEKLQKVKMIENKIIEEISGVTCVIM